MIFILLEFSCLSIFADFHFDSFHGDTVRNFVSERDIYLKHSHSIFSNTLFNVSADGNDTLCGGNSLVPCETVSRACALGDKVMVGVGTYEEKEGVTVTGVLSVIGLNSSQCILSKIDYSSLTMFILSGQFAKLTLANLTLLLTDSAEESFFVCGFDEKQILNLSECRITTQGGNQTLSYPSFVFTSSATFEISACIFHNITTVDKTDTLIIGEGYFSSMSITNSSFVNVASNGPGGCFFFETSFNISLTKCLFLSCNSLAGGGVGFVYRISGYPIIIQSCTFTNNSCNSTPGSKYNGGGVFLVGDQYHDGGDGFFNAINTSFIFCTSDVFGGVFDITAGNSASLLDCSFTLCSSRVGGALVFDRMAGLVSIERCTFVQCSANEGGALYAVSSAVTISDSVFLANTAGQDIFGSDCSFTGDKHFEFVRTFTDKEDVSLSTRCSGGNECANRKSLYTKADYDEATCNDSFTDDPVEGCFMPCAETNTGVCVKPDACPSNFTAVIGVCVHTCVFSVPSSTDSACAAPCLPDYSRGFPMCALLLSCDPAHFKEETGKCVLKSCEKRTNLSSLTFPCGSADCFQQVSNGGTGMGVLDSTCGSCDAAHFIESKERGVCVLKSCETRTTLSLLKFPCGTSDCYQQTNENGTYINECRDSPSPPTESKVKSHSTAIIIVVVVVVVVVVAVVVIIILVVLYRRRHKHDSQLLADWSCEPGSEVKNYTVRDNIGKSQNSELYEFVSIGKLYTAKRVHSESEACNGDLNWASDFSEKVDSKFLVKYFETIRGNRGECFLVMEHFQKGSLQTFLDTLKNVSKDALVSPVKIMKILIQVLFGLEVLHRHGIIHCDLCAENVFLDESDDAKIGGFGCTQREKMQRKDEEMRTFTEGGYVPWSNRSPEVVAGGKRTFCTDMWCLGAMCYELCSFPNDIDGNYEMVGQLKVPDALIEIIECLLKKDPAERPSALNLLQHPFIHEYATQLDLLKFFPSSATE